jgi:hypothetical protein
MSLDERDYMRERSVFGGKRKTDTWGRTDISKKNKIHPFTYFLGFLGVLSLGLVIWLIVRDFAF